MAVRRIACLVALGMAVVLIAACSGKGGQGLEGSGGMTQEQTAEPDVIMGATGEASPNVILSATGEASPNFILSATGQATGAGITQTTPEPNAIRGVTGGTPGNTVSKTTPEPAIIAGPTGEGTAGASGEPTTQTPSGGSSASDKP